MNEVLIPRAKSPVPIRPIGQDDWPKYLEKAPELVAWLAARGEFKAARGQMLFVPDSEAAKAHVLFGLGETGDAAAFRALPGKLPAGDYRIEDAPFDHAQLALNWALGAYRFERYRKSDRGGWPRLVVEKDVDLAEAIAVSHACALARDMINTPANDMGPLQIETIAREIAGQFRAKVSVVTGEALLEENYPAVHAVGRAAHTDRAPRMIEITWGRSGPLIALIGKGVVFDTGGLNIKPGGSMKLMKKDMGGAAHALALARMIMAARLKVRLLVLVPAVENAISGDAMRPGDVISTRKGLSVEVGNTDAEGRLILADALARAAEKKPDLTIDLATLTGAARVALGPQIPPYFTDDEDLAAALNVAGVEQNDPIWRLPLWPGYAEALDSDIADLSNDAAPWAQAGAVTAALFLKRFAPKGPWAHFDIFAWNNKARPGYPTGGEVQAIRAILAVIKARYA
jgi:leucyl aminopeptidase